MKVSSSLPSFLLLLQLFIICVISIPSQHEISLNSINLLLPITESREVNFVLEGYNGCFLWFTLFFFYQLLNFQLILHYRTSTRSEVVTVEPITEDGSPVTNHHQCTTRAIISPARGLEKRSSSWIIVEDIQTGKKLRCEVYIDKISKIYIKTTTRILYHNEIEQLFVQAHDEHGNLFSTLEGVQFHWNIATKSLSVVPFSSSSVEISSKVIKMEKEGKQGDSILVQGKVSGFVPVYASLVEAGYKGLF